MITVYCQDSSHAEIRWEIGSFILSSDTPPVWGFLPRSRPRRTSAALEGDRYLTRKEQSPRTPRTARIRYNLRCDLCRRPNVWRAELIHPVLDDLARNGIDTASLNLLAALH